MDTFLLKLVLTPALIGGATLAGPRFGRGIGGWLVGMPLTSGPVAFFIALDHGTSFASSTAIGSLAGQAAQSAFCLAYASRATRGSWPASLALGSVAFAAATLALDVAPLPSTSPFGVAALLAAVCAVLAATLRVLPRGHLAPATREVRLPVWDLPARMAVATALVVLITAAAPLLGARLSGLLTTYPVYATTLAVFAHRAPGGVAALDVLRGLLLGLFAPSAFFFVLAVWLTTIGIAAFLPALTAALVVQGLTLRAVPR